MTIWNTKTPRAPSEAEPSSQTTLRSGETSTKNRIRLVDGSLVTAEALRIIGQSLNVYRQGDNEYAATRSGLCVPLSELIAFAGSEEPRKLQAASDSFAPSDEYLPEEHPSPDPGSYLCHTLDDQAVRIVSKTKDVENGRELLVSDDETLYASLDYQAPYIMEREEHKETYPELYPVLE